MTKPRKKITVGWKADFEDQTYAYAGYAKEVYNMFVDAMNMRIRVLGVPTLPKGDNNRIFITLNDLIVDTDYLFTFIFKGVETKFFIKIIEGTPDFQYQRFLIDLKQATAYYNFPVMWIRTNNIISGVFSGQYTLTVLPTDLKVGVAVFSSGTSPDYLSLYQPPLSYPDNVDLQEHWFHRGIRPFDNQAIYGDQPITITNYSGAGWFYLQNHLYTLSDFFVKNQDANGTVGGPGFFNTKDIILPWSIGVDNKTYLDNQNIIKVQQPNNVPAQYVRYGPKDREVPNCFRRKYPREIVSFNEYGEEGWIARFILGSTIRINYKNQAGQVVLIDATEDDRQYSGDIYKFTLGKWVRVGMLGIPDILEAKGFAQQGDYFGGWILNDIRDAIDRYSWTFGAGHSTRAQHTGLHFAPIDFQPPGLHEIYTFYKIDAKSPIKLLDDADYYLFHDDNNVHIWRGAYPFQAIVFNDGQGRDQEVIPIPEALLGGFPYITASLTREWRLKLSPDGKSYGADINEDGSLVQTDIYHYFFAPDIPYTCAVDIYTEELTYTPVTIDHNDAGGLMYQFPNQTVTTVGNITTYKSNGIVVLVTEYILGRTQILFSAPKTTNGKPSFKYNYISSYAIDNPKLENKIGGGQVHPQATGYSNAIVHFTPNLNYNFLMDYNSKKTYDGNYIPSTVIICRWQFSADATATYQEPDEEIV